jgi:hypothetical protein
LATASFSRGRDGVTAPSLGKMRASACVHESGEEVRKGNSGSALPMAPESSGYARSYVGLRRVALAVSCARIGKGDGGGGGGGFIGQGRRRLRQGVTENLRGE